MAKPSRKIRGRLHPGKPDPKAFFNQAEVDAAKRATETPSNPSLVTDAFVLGDTPIKVGPFEIPPVGLGRYMILEKIKSPITEPGGAVNMSNDQLAALIFVCTKPEKLSRELLAQGGTAFTDAVLELADTIPLTAIRALGAAIGVRIAQAFSTIISSASSGGTGDGLAEKKTAGSSPGQPETTG
ncbi:MAG TPA: hypothetical protein VL357_06040 [Rariglobus sp.]|jgi:hypothetical protein|nr:hypothetical protein [Rariglobus sp.]